MVAQQYQGQSFAGRFAILFGGQIAFGGILLLNNILISRWIGPEGRGEVALALFVPYFAVYVANLGFPAGIAYFVSRREVDFRVGAGVTIVFCFAIAAILLGCGAMLFEPVRSAIYRGMPAQVVILSLASLPPLFVSFCFDQLWVAGNFTRAVVLVRLAQAIGYFVSAVVLVGGLHRGVVGAVIAFAIGAWLSLIALLIIATRAGGGLPRYQHSSMWTALRFGWRAHPGTVAEYALYRGDTFLVSYLAGFTALGYYAFAQPLAELMWLLSISVRPILYAETSRSDPARAASLVGRAVRFTLLAGLLLAAAVSLFALVITKTVLPLFAPAVPVVAILVTATLSATVFQLILADLTSRGRGGTASRVSLTVFPFAVLAYIALVPPLGAIGAALGSLIAYSSQSALALRAYRRVTGVPAREIFAFSRGDFREGYEKTLAVLNRRK